MTNYEVKTALERIHKKEYSRGNAMKEFFTKGFQINRCYVDDWDEINNIFREYNMQLNSHGPIITISQREYVRLAHEITQDIKDDEEIREIFSTGIYSGKSDYNQVIDGRIFINILRILPSFSLRYSKNAFKKWCKSNKSTKQMEKLTELNGTIKTTEKETNEIIQEIINSL